MRTFQGALSRGAFVLTTELSPVIGGSAARFLRQASDLHDHVDGIQLAEPSGEAVAVSHTALAALLIRAGIDAIPTLNCRDRNRIALHSEILGLRAVGVTSMVLVRGSADSGGRHPPARTVFDIGSSELIAMAHEIDETGLLLGTDATVPDSRSTWDAAALRRRSAAGARFLKLRSSAGLDRLRDQMARLVDEKLTWHFSVLPSLAPEELGAGACARMIRDVRGIPGVSGINLLCLEDTGAVIDALKASGLKPLA